MKNTAVVLCVIIATSLCSCSEPQAETHADRLSNAVESGNRALVIDAMAAWDLDAANDYINNAPPMHMAIARLDYFSMQGDAGNSILYLECIKLLAEEDELLNHTDELGRTPLHLAARLSVSITRILIDAGAILNKPDAASQTPLQIAEAHNENSALLLSKAIELRNQGTSKEATLDSENTEPESDSEDLFAPEKEAFERGDLPFSY